MKLDEIVQLDENFFTDNLKAFAIIGGIALGGYAGVMQHQQAEEWMEVYQQVQQQDPETARELKLLIDKYRHTPIRYSSSMVPTAAQINSIIKDFKASHVDNGQQQ